MARRHPYVKLIPPNDEGRVSWRARCRNPKQPGKYKWKTLSGMSKRQREDWAVRESEKIERTILEIHHGVGPRASDHKESTASLADARDLFFEDTKAETGGSVDTYSIAIEEFLDFVERSRRGLRRGAAVRELPRTAVCSDVSDHMLMDWRGMVLSKPPVRTRKKRSRETMNRELRNVGRMVRHLRKKRKLFPHLTSDEIDNAFELLKTGTKKKDFLRYKAIRTMLECLLEYDANPERRGPPMAALFLLTLFYGTRRHEVVPCSGIEHAAIEWPDVHLDEIDGRGNRIGEIHAREATKTGHRPIGLEYAPAGQRLLSAMKLRAGGKGKVFPYTEDQVNAAYRALRRNSSFPKNATLQTLRRTSETFAVNSRIMTLSQAIAQYGHSESTALKSYIGALRNIPAEHVTFEAAMMIEDLAEQIIDAVSAGGRASVSRIAGGA